MRRQSDTLLSVEFLCARNQHTERRCEILRVCVCVSKRQRERERFLIACEEMGGGRAEGYLWKSVFIVCCVRGVGGEAEIAW